MSNIYSAIKKVFRKIIIFLSKKNWLKFLSDEKYLRLYFWARMGQKLNLDNPKTYNEKIQWLKLHDRDIEYTNQVDKYEVRKLIENTIGKDYLIPLIGVYDRVEDINWTELPNKFVLKATHGSGSNIICRNKNDLNIEDARAKLKKWMNRNWFWFGRAYPYKNIKPRIICEPFLEENITDYKFMCFHGEPKLIQVHQNREDGSKTLDFYDMNWKKTSIKRPYEESGNCIERPTHFEKMKEIAKTLSASHIHVRIDLYEVGGKIYFGEKTFYSTSGFSPFATYEQDLLIGSWMDLSKNNT